MDYKAKYLKYKFKYFNYKNNLHNKYKGGAEEARPEEHKLQALAEVAAVAEVAAEEPKDLRGLTMQFLSLKYNYMTHEEYKI